MREPNFIVVVCTVFFSSVMLLAGLYLLAKFNSLFRKTITNDLLRKNIVVWMIAVCFILSLTPTRQEFYNSLTSMRVLHYFIVQLIAATVEVLFVFNIARLVIQYLDKKNVAFLKKMG